MIVALYSYTHPKAMAAAAAAAVGSLVEPK